MSKNAYAQSGVDVEAGYEVVERIKKHVARTERAGVMGGDVYKRQCRWSCSFWAQGSCSKMSWI